MRKTELSGKQDFQEMMMDILNPLLPHYSEGCARLNIGVTAAHYDQGAVWMEAFARPLWGLVPFHAGGGSSPEFDRIYREGLANGTDPDHPEYWGEPADYDQRFVEMAAIAYAILMQPEIYWEPLTEQGKKNLAGYLYKINEHELPDCNWIFFDVLVNIAMKKVGYPYSEECLARYLDRAEAYYLGEGWYKDGGGDQRDYYISFAIHFYSLIYAKFMDQEDPERARLYRDRACLFAKQFIYWFDEDGPSIAFGRSMTYRFAQVSFFSACLLAGVEPFPVPVMKGLITRHLRSWLERPVFDRDGILTIGYGYPNLLMAEQYNAPGSPYWCMKAFAFLALPDDHPFWSAQAGPLPQLPPQCAMEQGAMILRRYPGHVTAYAPGLYSSQEHNQMPAKYGKFAYDSKFGFSIAKSSCQLHEAAPDSMLAFCVGDYVFIRRICQEYRIVEKSVYSRWSPFPGIEVETVLMPTEEGHIRKHRITSSIACEAVDGGFAVSNALGEQAVKEEKETEGLASNSWSSCSVKSRKGEGRGEVIIPSPNTNLLYPKTLIPAVRYQIREGVTELETEVRAAVFGPRPSAQPF